ncbi:M23 family metallopeptidase [Romboutsia sp. Marseille-P6047]|uniref:M23 family metallopeptidase n=1 Tax=Romboutsia sp. Marseille-P6047 TaxID=2161817 RepID=UPI000F05A112|nr:M23 family metallopeptidase [Romboutsia sp. Marseille-P6047]
MDENFKKVILHLFVSLLLVMSVSINKMSYAFGEENKLDMLIENKEKQSYLKAKIDELNNRLESKKQELKNDGQDDLNDDNELEIVKLSFIQEDSISDEEEAIKSDINNMEQEKETLGKQLQDELIEGVQLEKCLEEEAAEKLSSEGIDFIKGIWPLKEYKDISSGYGYRIHPITNIKSFHKGIDIPAPQDTDILAIDDGIVSFSGYQNGYGNVVKINHFDGKTTIYAHNNYNIVQEGDIVKQGQVISKVGTTGDSTGIMFILKLK